MKKDIKSILEQDILEKKLLNDNCLYVKQAVESIIRVKAYFVSNPLMDNISSNYIYTYLAVDEGKYQIETTKTGIAVIYDNKEEKKLVALYDAINNINIVNFDTNISDSNSDYYVIMDNQDEPLKKIKK